jgi:hypothetical protein
MFRAATASAGLGSRASVGSRISQTIRRRVECKPRHSGLREISRNRVANLERVSAGESWMLSEIDLAHHARAQERNDAVPREHVTGSQRHGRIVQRASRQASAPSCYPVARTIRTIRSLYGGLALHALPDRPRYTRVR